ncbi:hypothetical protein [Shinella sp.]|uniref:hypothetical protein n=1 Tax=Shinella sp. TaxID=1870904 RepID=UPI003F71C923
MAEFTEASSTESPRKKREAVRTFLVADRTPMWFTTLALMVGGIGTYYLAPQVNATFEEQKIKTDFVIRNYSDLRQKMEDFQGLYAVVTQKQAAGLDIQDQVFKLQEIVSRVSAQNLSMMPMFTTAEGPKTAAQVNAAMNGMIVMIFANAGKTIEAEADVKAYNEAVAKASQALVPPLLQLYVSIGEVGRLRPTAVTTDLPEK